MMSGIRDANLRLVYAEQEKASISAGLGKARRNLAIHGALLCLVAVFWLTDAGPSLSEFGRNLGNGLFALLMSLSLLGFAVLLPVVACVQFLRAAIELRRYLGFRRDHAALLRRYNRIV